MGSHHMMAEETTYIGDCLLCGYHTSSKHKWLTGLRQHFHQWLFCRGYIFGESPFK